jgi:DNA-binding transcriptional MerR regulator
MTVGALARGAGVTPKTIRYYEDIGLLPPARRGENGYRYYPRESVNRLSFIQRAKLLGLSLAEIHDLIAVSDEGLCAELAPELYQVLERKVAEIDQQLVELAAFRATLAAAAERLAPCEEPACDTSCAPVGSPFLVDCGCLPTVSQIVLRKAS